MLSVEEKFNKILKKYEEKWGYALSPVDIVKLWLDGELSLTDSEEDALIEYTELHDL